MNSDYSRAFKSKTGSCSDFEKIATNSISDFVINNKILNAIDSKTFNITQYHSLLINIFHQVFNSSHSFALAASMCSTSQILAKEYLLHHAEEEATHWQWILNDLKNTGYEGEDPRDMSASASTTAYFSYGYYLALKFPLGRLGMAYVLEGISATFGVKYGSLVKNQLNLSHDQLQFFLSHGELDQGHEKDILDVLKKSNLTEADFGQLSHIAKTTSKLYKGIYNEAL